METHCLYVEALGKRHCSYVEAVFICGGSVHMWPLAPVPLFICGGSVHTVHMWRQCASAREARAQVVFIHRYPYVEA